MYYNCVKFNIVGKSVSLLRLYCPWNSPGKNIGVGYYALLQEIFLTQGSNLHLPHCREILYHLSHQGSPNSWQGRCKCEITPILIF